MDALPADQPIQAIEQPQPVSNHKKIKFVVIGVVSLIFFVLVAFLLLQQQKKSNPNQMAFETPTPYPQAKTYVTAPKVHFASYIDNVTLPTVPILLNIYTLKNNLTQSDLSSLGTNLHIPTAQATQADGGYLVASNQTDKNYRGILAFFTPTGSFTYQSFGDLRPNAYVAGDVHPTSFTGQNAQAEALDMLHQIGVADSTVTCPITYTKAPLTDVTNVECHRDWSKVGLPVLDIVGLLSVPQSQRLSSLQIGTVDAQSPSEPSITNVTGIPNGDGRSRPNTFNTATVQVAPDGRILGITSNLRMIANTQTVVSNQIVTPDEALIMLKNNQAVFSLTLPAGQGSYDWKKVYQNNIADADSATITDLTLAYIEKPTSLTQTYLVPMYIARGYATLKSGYQVSFVQAIPALKNNTTFLTSVGSLNRQVAAAETKVPANPGIQLQTFETPPPTPTTIPIATTIPPSPTVTLQPNSTLATPTTAQVVATPTPSPISCQPPAQFNSTITIQIPGMGSLKITTAESTPHTFYYVDSGFPVSVYDDFRSAIYKAVEDQFVINVATDLTKSGGALPPLGSIDDVKHAFDVINNEKISTSCPPIINNPRPAPPMGCSYVASSGVGDRVAQRILSAAQSNSLSSLVQPDIFPTSSIQNLQWALSGAGSTSDPGNNPNNIKTCYVSGYSPRIFIYSPTMETVKINLPDVVTYANPALRNKSFTVTAHPDGSLISQDNVNLDSLYYEYDGSKVSFFAPKTGFVVERNNLAAFISSLSKQAGLNTTETNALQTEVHNALLNTTNTKYIEVGLIPQNELDAKLPLKIFPQPMHVYHLHLLLKPTNTFIKISAPTIQVVNRNGFSVVEIGARTQ